MRVEVGVEDNDSICAPEIDTDAACASCQKIDEDIRILLVEFVHSLLTVRLFRTTVLFPFISIAYFAASSSMTYKSEILGTLADQEVLDYVERDRKLSRIS